MSDSEDKLRGLMVLGNAGDRAAYNAFLQALGAHLRAFFRRRLVQLPDEIEDWCRKCCWWCVTTGIPTMRISR